ncbi:hypothetical protein NUACC21_46280 [Scytonema sp. NUACC21]
MPKHNNEMLEMKEIVSLGMSLRAIEQKILKPGYHQGTKRIWFQGDEPYFDVFFELKNEDIVWFQVTLRGSSLSWSKKNGLQTGSTNELSIDNVIFYPASKIIENDSQINWNFIELVKTIFQARGNEEIFAKALGLFHER